MRSVRSCVLVLVAALAVTGCVNESKVQLEDGSTAHDLDCFGGAWACKNEAERVCGNRPYVVLDDSPALEIMSKGQQASMRVQCVDDYVAARTPAPESKRIAPPEDKGSVCRVVYREVTRLAKSWAVARNGEPKAESPPEDAFVGACVSLPREAQLCLAASYRHAHPTCPKVLGALDDPSKERLDATLLGSRRPDQSDAPPPGTLDL